ncbi:MAG TPA: ankyrin repeat domain-containing protein, partial [Gemmatimonadetes bacterium]|nr:ankyrin repeat domain-containing protein [Gemmatimonadota bacterium]
MRSLGSLSRSVGVLCMATALWGSISADTAITDAARRGDAEAVRALLRGGADVNASEGDGMTALHW